MVSVGKKKADLLLVSMEPLIQGFWNRAAFAPINA